MTSIKMPLLKTPRSEHWNWERSAKAGSGTGSGTDSRDGQRDGQRWGCAVRQEQPSAPQCLVPFTCPPAPLCVWIWFSGPRDVKKPRYILGFIKQRMLGSSLFTWKHQGFAPKMDLTSLGSISRESTKTARVMQLADFQLHILGCTSPV